MRHAVAAMLVVGDEIFIVQRQSYLPAFPGYCAFPGGKIDAEDEQQAAVISGDNDAAHVNAVCRELQEELSFDLVEATNNQQILSFSYFGTATTPVTEVVRFAVHHYKITLPQKPCFTLDHNELQTGKWFKFIDFHRQYLAGEALLVTPMLRAVIALIENPQLEILNDFSDDPDSKALDFYPFLHDVFYAAVPSNTLPPAYATNSILVGDEHHPKVLVDPSPKSIEVLAELKTVLDGYQVDAILLSHHHPDHHQFSMDIARDRQIPVLCSEVTLERLHQTLGIDYTLDVRVELIAEGVAVTQWKGHAVRAYDLPGHDDGMLGLAPDNMAWFFVADLAQSYGSIYIPEEEGDLTVYMQSLQRVIDLNPRVVLPSHGIAEGGVHMLQRTLDHRVERENQIRALLEQGADHGAILDSIYPDLAENLKSLALQNIRQHIKKLDEISV
ncbi:MAG: ribonuclease/clavin/mitogillin [Saprospiraceae bacterium]|jgi:ribonuclease/clavin/mitogillin